MNGRGEGKVAKCLVVKQKWIHVGHHLDLFVALSHEVSIKDTAARCI